MSPAAALLDGRGGPRSLARAPEGLPRLLAGVGRHPLALTEHEALHGPLPSVRGAGRRRRRGRAAELIAEVDRAGLRGRGGAAFPTAAKLRAVAGAGRRAVVVVNGVEAEPASSKDRALLQALPHLVLDGAVLAAETVGAEEAILAVGRDARLLRVGLERAISERESAGCELLLGLAGAPERYVAGQETALVSHLNGGAAKPTFTPPLPFERGVRRRPTLVSNAETLAHLALIARHGASWFRALGTPSEPGSALVTISGAVRAPGVYEIEQGATLSSLIQAAGGPSAPLGAALLGGYGGGFLAGEQLDSLRLSNADLARHGIGLGAGVVVLLSRDACPVAESARLARWLAAESARQCGPCMFGLDSLAELLGQVARGAAPAEALARLQRLAATVARRGACAHPDLAVNTITSSLRAFEREFAAHLREGPCERCAGPGELQLPEHVETPWRSAR